MQRYDIPTAITFLFAGLGMGAVLAILFAPRPEQPSTEGERIFDTEFRMSEDDEEAFASRAV
jgi:hypothetical protein